MKETNSAAHTAVEPRKPLISILVASTENAFRAAIAAALHVSPTVIYDPPTKLGRTVPSHFGPSHDR